jgi:hypothetical protein
MDTPESKPITPEDMRATYRLRQLQKAFSSTQLSVQNSLRMSHCAPFILQYHPCSFTNFKNHPMLVDQLHTVFAPLVLQTRLVCTIDAWTFVSSDTDRSI